MKRIQSWDVELINYAQTVKDRPFIWGQTNCAALAAACVDAMTGTKLFELQKALDLNEEKAREFSAQRLTRKTLLDAGLVDAGPAEFNLVQRGDILLAYSEGWECSHICLGRFFLTSSPAKGVHLVPMAILRACPGLNFEVLRCL